MGHIRLHGLVRTRHWSQVVAFIAYGAGAEQVAHATLHAAEHGLNLAGKDVGVIESIYLLMQLPLAARTADFAEALRQGGLTVSDAPSLLEIVGAVNEAVDAKIPNCKGKTDLGETAQIAAVETLTAVIGERVSSFFGTTSTDVHQAFAKLATVKQFSIFAKDFFGRFMYKCLNYFLSKTLADHIGENQRFRTLAEQSEFTQALETHCQEAAKIVESYSGEWFSKKKWERGGEITRQEVQKFTSYAMTKLTAELQQGAAAHGS